MSISSRITSIEEHIGGIYDTLELGGAFLLPKEYTQVDYIESSGTQYIDTGYKPNQDTNIIIDTDYSPSGVQLLLGERTLSSGNSTKALIIGQMSNSTTNISIYYGSQNSIVAKTEATGRKKHQIHKNLYYVDNVLKNTFEVTTFEADYNLSLFGLNSNGTVGNFATAKMYYCKIYDNDILVRDYIPCYRNSDNEVGLYDLVNNVFYTNQGTGTFVAGAKTFNKNLVNISPVLRQKYIDYMNNGTQEIWNNWEKVTGTGEIIKLDNTIEAPMKVDVKGNSGQNGEPSPENEVLISNVGENINMLDYSTMQDGYVGSNGAIVTTHTQDEMYSEFIKVEPNTWYIFRIMETASNYTSWIGVGEYTSNSYDSFIKRNVNDGFFVTSETTEYIVISARNLKQATKVQLTTDTDKFIWSPYNQGNIITTVSNKNVGNMELLYEQMKFYNPNYCRKETVDGKDCIVFSNYRFQRSRDTTQWNFKGLKGSFKENTRYRLNCKIRVYDTTITSGKSLAISLKAKDNTGLANKNMSAAGSTWLDFEMITPANTSTDYICFSYGSVTDWCITDLSITEYVEGEEYEYTPSQVQVIPFTLEEGQRMYLGDYLADDGIHHVRKQTVLDGTESWEIATDYGFGTKYTEESGFIAYRSYINHSLGLISTANDGNALSNIANGKVWSTLQATPQIGFCIIRYTTSTRIWFAIPRSVADTVEDFKTYLQNNNVTVEDELIEEEITPYTTEQQTAWEQIKQLKSYYEQTNISGSSDESNPIFEVTALKNV